MSGESGEFFLSDATERWKISLKILDQKKTSEKLVQTVETWKDVLHVLEWASPYSHNHHIDH